jgi:hypothetical protein
MACEEVNLALMSIVAESFESSIVCEAQESKPSKETTDVEYQSLVKNNTWQLVDLQMWWKKRIDCKWVFKNKYNSNGNIDKYKARILAQGYAQKEGSDYEEAFAPIAKINTMRMISAMATQFG